MASRTRACARQNVCMRAQLGVERAAPGQRHESVALSLVPSCIMPSRHVAWGGRPSSRLFDQCQS